MMTNEVALIRPLCDGSIRLFLKLGKEEQINIWKRDKREIIRIMERTHDNVLSNH